MRKIVAIFMLMFFVLTTASCGSKEEHTTGADDENSTNDGNSYSIDLDNPVEKPAQTQDEKPGVSLDLAGCGEVYKSGSLSYNVIGLRTETVDDTTILLIKMEVHNDRAESVNYETLSTLELYDENGELCDNDMFARVESGLHGNILPGNRLVGEVAFNITDGAEGDYVLHIGEFYEYSPAIKIKGSDIGMTFSEQFGTNSIDREYTDYVESEELTIKINSAATADDNGQKVLLIDISVTNNGAESTDLFAGLYLDGVYSMSGSKLVRAMGQYWDYLNHMIEPGDTKNGVLAYKIDEGETDFYMVVAPDSSNYSETATLVFSAE